MGLSVSEWTAVFWTSAAPTSAPSVGFRRSSGRATMSASVPPPITNPAIASSSTPVRRARVSVLIRTASALL
jgi:hypothetical protein